MLKPSTFRALVSGRRRGPLAALTRAALRLAEVPYTWVVNRRNLGYESGRRDVHHVDVPVISVGNLTLGGTGKTPTVEWLARFLQQQKLRVAIVSRGYGTSAAQPNDEALELAEKLPDVPHVQNPDRVAAAATAIDQHQCNVIVLDDGFQHRRLGRDLDMVLIDALEPFGFEHVFPRGTLREPIAGLARADAVALTRAEMVDADQREQIRDRVRELAPQAVWLEIAHRPTELTGTDGQAQPLNALSTQRVAAFCGIGNPLGFRRTLAQCQWDVVGWREFDDHHAYDEDDLSDLKKWFEDCGGQAMVCTRKDLVKLRDFWPAGLPLSAVTVTTEILQGIDSFTELLAPLIERSGR